MNAAGGVIINSQLGGPGVTSSNAFGVWEGSAGNLSLVARQGDQAPGMPADTTFFSANSNLSPFKTDIDSQGHAAFFSEVSTVAFGIVHNWGIWVSGPGGLSLAAATGGHAPGLPSGVNFDVNGSEVYVPVVNTHGALAFGAPLAGQGVNSSNSSGIWAGLPGSLSLIVQQGDQAPGVAIGTTFGRLDGISNSRHVGPGH